MCARRVCREAAGDLAEEVAARLAGHGFAAVSVDRAAGLVRGVDRDGDPWVIACRDTDRTDPDDAVVDAMPDLLAAAEAPHRRVLATTAPLRADLQRVLGTDGTRVVTMEQLDGVIHAPPLRVSRGDGPRTSGRPPLGR